MLRAAYIVLQTRHVGHICCLAERVLQQAQREVGSRGGPGAGVRCGGGQLEVSGGSRRLEGVVQPVPQPEARLVQQASGRGAMDVQMGATVGRPAATLCCLQDAMPVSGPVVARSAGQKQPLGFCPQLRTFCIRWIMLP